MGCTDARGMHGQGRRACSQVREAVNYLLGCLIVRERPRVRLATKFKDACMHACWQTMGCFRGQCSHPVQTDCIKFQ